MVSACRRKTTPFPLLDLPTELVEKVVGTFGPGDQDAKKNARATCTQLRSAANVAVTSVKVLIFPVCWSLHWLPGQQRLVEFSLHHTFMQASDAAVQIGSKNEGMTLPPSILPQLSSVTMNVSNGREEGMWTAKNLALLGLAGIAFAIHLKRPLQNRSCRQWFIAFQYHILQFTTPKPCRVARIDNA